MTLTEQQINALFERGNNFIRMGNFAAAVRDYDQVIEHRADFAPAYFNRAIARHHGLADFSGAHDDYSTALNLRPNFPEAYANRAILHKQQGDYAAALTDFDAALRKGDSHVIRNNRAEVHFLRGDYAAALADFEAAARLRPGYRFAAAGSAIAHAALGAMDRARAIWGELVERDPGFLDAAWVQNTLQWDAPLMQQAQPLIDQLQVSDSHKG